MPLIITKDAICKYIGEPKSEFLALVRDKKLPAYRTRKNGRWKARREDLNTWINLTAEEQLRAAGAWFPRQQ